MNTFSVWDRGISTIWNPSGTLFISESSGTTIDDTPEKMCPYCSGTYSYIFHSGICPKVAAIEYYPNGAVKKVEFRQA